MNNNNIKKQIQKINDELRNNSLSSEQILTLINTRQQLIEQESQNQIVCCFNTPLPVNLGGTGTTITEVIPVIKGGTGLSSIPSNGIIIGTNTSTPSIQILSGSVVDTTSYQYISGKIINGNCNSITNVGSGGNITGILPIIQGGTGISSIPLNGIIVGANTAIPTIQTINGHIIDTSSHQSIINKIIDGNCNSITNISFSGILPVSSGGTGRTAVDEYSLIVGGTSSSNPFQVINGTGSSGQILTSLGDTTLPIWKDPTALPILESFSLEPVYPFSIGTSSYLWIRDYFTNINYNYGDLYNPTTGRVTIINTGLYLINFKIIIDSPPAMNNFNIRMETNPNIAILNLIDETIPSGLTRKSWCVSLIRSFQRFDLLLLYITTESGVPVNIQGGSNTMWAISRIG